MGVFFDRATPSMTAINSALREALAEDPAAVGDLAQAAAKRTDSLQPGGGGFHAGRFLIAVLILAGFVVGAVITDAKGVDDSSKALYGFATTILGVIVGLLGGEKSSSS